MIPVSRFRSCVLALLLLAVLTSLFPVSALAAEAVVTGSEVNVRTGPGLEYEVFASLKRNTVVTVTDRSDPAWYLISWSGGLGYVSSSFLRIEEEGGSSAVIEQEQRVPDYSGNNIVIPYGGSTVILGEAESTPTPTPTPTPAATPEAYSVTVQLRPSPTPVPTPTPAATPSPGQSVVSVPVVTEPPRSTAPAEEPGVVVTGGITLTPSPSPSVTPSPVPSPSVSGGTAEQQASVSEANAEIIGNSVRFRNGPGTTYTIISVLDKGTKLTVNGRSGDWFSALIGGVSGYVHSDYVAALAPAAQTPVDASAVNSNAGSVKEEDSSSVTVTLSLGLAPAATPAVQPVAASNSVQDGYVNAGSVRMREGPSMTAQILVELSYGTRLKITGVSDVWYRVICGGLEGFIYSDYVTVGSFEPAAGITKSTGAELGKEIAVYALNFVGYPYTWGGKSPATGFDCSGFVQYVFSQFGYTTSRVANDVTSDGVHVDPSQIQPGDVLCFYSGNGYVGHVGIYIGDNSFVHAANSATGVVITSLSVGYYASRGYEIRRII